MQSRIIIGIVLLLGASAVFLVKRNNMPEEREIIRIGSQELSVEIADTLEKQIRGLSGHQPLKENEGMLFAYENPRVLSFWMRDMRFPIDIIWIDEGRDIVGIAPNLSPDTFPQTFSSAVPVQYVLEVSAGWAELHGVVIGDQAAW